MTLMSKGRFVAEGMPAEMIQQVIKRQQAEVVEAILSKIEAEKPYSIVMHKEIYPINYWEKESRVYIDIEPIPQIKMVYMSPEELHFTPSKSLWKKLKNCWQYLCDDSEGHYEQEK